MTILLLMIYSLASWGVGIRQFYCCGKLKSVNIAITQDSRDHCGKGDKKPGCCENKYQFFKVKDTHIAAEGINHPAKFAVEFDSHLPAPDFAYFSNQAIYFANYTNGPPLAPGKTIYIFNCIFRI